ncbi:MAG TPA: hypothetical protein VET88_01110 [Gammaproteobacteria bacterium]|nr:hypothetical protein [Gammaproteobacteria bacterium]
MTTAVHGWMLPVLLITLPVNAATQAPTAVRDLQYGEVLYYFFQQDYFDSIVHLQIAQQQQRLPNHAEEAELLLGGLDLAYGLTDAADRIFRKLLAEEDVPDEVRNRAWFYLAKLSYQRGDNARALQALEQTSGSMSATTRAEATHLQSLLLLQLGRNTEAITLLEAAEPNHYWTPYLEYNLGVARIRDRQFSAGMQQLEQLGEGTAHSDESRLLRDKANLALGYSYLHQGDPARSRQALERVRLQGPLSGKALLGTGWADAEAEDFDRALVPWTELGSRDTADPATQEALLAIPYAMTRLRLHGLAVAHYNEAIQALQTEQAELDKSIEAIQRGELLQAIEAAGAHSGSGWRQQPGIVRKSPALRYQVMLMASHNFQEAVKNYIDLEQLLNNLDAWSDNMDAFDDMLETRQARFTANRPAAEQALQQTPQENMQQRRAQLATRLADIEARDEPVGLANRQELQQWRQLEEIGARLTALPVSRQSTALREKQRRLQGILIWQLNTDYKARLQQARQQLAELDTLSAATRKALDKLRQADFGTPAGFTDYSRRIHSQKAVLQQLLSRTMSARHAQGARIEQLAVTELEQQQQRLDSYIVQARFALAQSYDDALQGHKEAVP